MILRVIGRRQETHDTVTFLLEGRLAPYVPGQFLTLLVNQVRRSFSLTSSPGDPYYAITVKRKTNGEVSRYLQDHVHEGAVLKALPPAGRFTFQPRPGVRRDIGFIAAGSGIAPILPLIKQALAEEPESHVWLIDQNHSEADVIFGKELHSLEARLTRVSLLSAPFSHTILPRRLNNASLEQLVGGLMRFDPLESIVFCCGPEALMRMARFTLRVMGFGAEQFRQEHFTVDPVPHAPLLSDTTQKQVVLLLHGKRYVFPVAYPANILQAALDHHIPLPYSCRGGRCSSCAVRCVEGKVVMSINDVLTDRDLSEGWVLTCTGYAASDLELEG